MRDPNVPESLEGWWILHRMFALDRRAWDALPEKRRNKYCGHAIDLIDHLKNTEDGDLSLTQLVGDKGDLMLTHYVRTYEGLSYAQTLIDKLELRDFLQPRSSFVSVLELGLYDATGKIHTELSDRGLAPQSTEWKAAFDELVRKQAENPHVAPRLWARIPQRRYACFYPMNKRRGEVQNWYLLGFDARAKMMSEHGVVGRSYHGQVTQVISGSIGYDDYEWGVDLYADDPIVFKKLIYEMRFDEVSARYAEFGSFWSGLQFSPEELGVFLDGDAVPQLLTTA
ncbi:MAG TPA: hydrogen peroxide-dependent heme synthase [Candidatus Baltobacteraceae bacterium]|jgi:chlorite dismutase|nr:hydrogen peroxide-dependent heme synthase [Candidatus Baltobacteraceae bacterium]